LPAVGTAATITHTYNVTLGVYPEGVPIAGDYKQYQLPISGFDRNQGRFVSATVDVLLRGWGVFGYGCDWFDGYDLSCRTFIGYDSSGNAIYEYPRFVLSGTIGLNVSVFPESSLPDWRNAGYVQIINGASSDFRVESCCSDGNQAFEFGQTLMATGTSSNPLFAGGEPLIMLTTLYSSADTSAFSYFEGGGIQGDATVTVRYDYEPVPEPNYCALTLLALIAAPSASRLWQKRQRIS
jgi:hypothetical protein